MLRPEEPERCPALESFLYLLSRPWILYILWILRHSGPTRFGALKRQVQGISSKILTERLRMLEEAEIVYRSYEPTIPPQVTYGLTERAQVMVVFLDMLDTIAQKWDLQEKRKAVKSQE